MRNLEIAVSTFHDVHFRGVWDVIRQLPEQHEASESEENLEQAGCLKRRCCWSAGETLKSFLGAQQLLSTRLMDGMPLC